MFRAAWSKNTLQLANSYNSAVSPTVPPTAGLTAQEEGFLATYNVLCTVLTIGLNTFLVLIILTKVNMRRNIPCIPILCASVLGLLHGFGCNVLLSVSLLNGSWVGALDWCGAIAVLHKYVVYCIIYCLIVVSFETAYLVANPLSYHRDTRAARRSMCFATFCAVFAQLPITICHFFYLQPDQIQAKYPDSFAEYGDNFYIYLQKFVICYRFYYPGTFDYKLITYFTLCANVLALLYIVLSFVAIAWIVANTRSAAANRKEAQFTGSTAVQQVKRKQHQQRKQNLNIALRSLVLTVGTTLPWLPNLVMSVLLDLPGLHDTLWERHGPALYDILDVTSYIYYIVPWLFPLLAILSNPGIFSAVRNWRPRHVAIRVMRKSNGVSTVIENPLATSTNV